MGVDNQSTMPHAEAVFDDYFRRGGNVFDTAHIYKRLSAYQPQMQVDILQESSSTRSKTYGVFFI